MGFAELEMLARGLGPLAGAVAFTLVVKHMLERFIDRENQRASAADLAEQAWLDPDLRRN